MNEKKESRPTYIYVLKDPRTGEIRYVGKTVKKVERRLTAHISEALKGEAQTYKCRWIRSLIACGLTPIVEIIETVPPNEDWVCREAYWIKWYRDNNYDLTNLTDGGDGLFGYTPTEETVNKRRGRKASPETIEKLRIASTGRKHTTETKEKCRLINLGRVRSDETRKRISEAQIGRQSPPEHMAKMTELRKVGVAQYSLDRVLISTFDSIKDAYIALGVKKTTMWNWVNGRTICKDFVFERISKDDLIE